MLKARYYQTDGAQSGEQNLPEWLFDGVVNENVLHQVIKAYLSNQRQGTAAAKSRGQVAGGASKPWKQKGTGRARQGTIRAVQWAGGGVAFPPIPHSWRQRVPKKVRALARRSAFNARAQGERVVLVDALEFDAPKTKQLLGLFSAIGADGKILVLTDGPKESVYLSARNLPNVETRPFGQESVYDILWANVVVIEKAALDGAEPSEADRDAAVARDRGEPEVRSREREAAETQAKRKKARRGHKKTAKPTAPKVKADTIAGGINVVTVKLPKVGDMSDFLAQFDSADDVKALQARDSRKTAQAHYDVRLLEISGGADVQEEGDDA